MLICLVDIIFSEYYELRNGQKVYKNKLLKVKETMNIGFRMFPKSKFIRKRVLAFGCPICCPAVTYPRRIYKNFKCFPNLMENLCVFISLWWVTEYMRALPQLKPSQIIPGITRNWGYSNNCGLIGLRDGWLKDIIKPATAMIWNKFNLNSVICCSGF